MYKWIIGLLAVTTVLTAEEITMLCSKNVARQKKSSKGQNTEQETPYIVQADQGVIAYGEFLYWAAHEDGLEYAATTDILSSQGKSKSSGGFQGKTHIRDVHANYRPGVRAGLGYLLSHKMDGWDILANWTGYTGKADGHASANGTTAAFISPLWGNLFFISPLTTNFGYNKAIAHWHLDYNVVNLELGRNTLLGRKVTIRPYLGAEWAGINQHYRVKYKAPGGPEDTTQGFPQTLPFTSKFRAQNDFSGIGLRMGADAKWHITRHFGVCGEVSGAFLWGRTHINEKFTIPAITSISTNPPFTTKSDPSKIREKSRLSKFRPNLQGSAGLFWNCAVQKDKGFITLAAEYEFTAWFFQNNLYVNSLQSAQSSGGRASGGGFVQADSKNGLLSLQGLTFSLRYEF